ncbi:unnamed protein product [Lactuca virosa]|uniref:Uncharacterized protein n=1 Tax=Lactuca virosa TaxID=75947 RepID=A0AAU9NRQ9_9ASTR|nr:unnamed protein product [Lactuca virosa]
MVSTLKTTKDNYTSELSPNGSLAYWRMAPKMGFSQPPTANQTASRPFVPMRERPTNSISPPILDSQLYIT